jgi:hypothetical protein
LAMTLSMFAVCPAGTLYGDPWFIILATISEKSTVLSELRCAFIPSLCPRVLCWNSRGDTFSSCYSGLNVVEEARTRETSYRRVHRAWS